MHKQDCDDSALPPSSARSWATVASFAAVVEAHLAKWLSHTHRLGLTEYRALGQLATVPDGVLRVTDLAMRIGLNQSSVTRLLHRLEHKGLTSRDSCTEDGRGVRAVITERGRCLSMAIDAGFEVEVQDLLEHASMRLPLVDGDRVRIALTDVGQLLR